MTAYEHGFMTKCAEYGIPAAVAGRMMKLGQEFLNRGSGIAESYAKAYGVNPNVVRNSVENAEASRRLRSSEGRARLNELREQARFQRQQSEFAKVRQRGERDLQLDRSRRARYEASAKSEADIWNSLPYQAKAEWRSMAKNFKSPQEEQAAYQKFLQESQSNLLAGKYDQPPAQPAAAPAQAPASNTQQTATQQPVAQGSQPAAAPAAPAAAPGSNTQQPVAQGSQPVSSPYTVNQTQPKKKQLTPILGSNPSQQTGQNGVSPPTGASASSSGGNLSFPGNGTQPANNTTTSLNPALAPLPPQSNPGNLSLGIYGHNGALGGSQPQRRTTTATAMPNSSPNITQGSMSTARTGVVKKQKQPSVFDSFMAKRQYPIKPRDRVLQRPVAIRGRW